MQCWLLHVFLLGELIFPCSSVHGVNSDATQPTRSLIHKAQSIAVSRSAHFLSETVTRSANHSANHKSGFSNAIRKQAAASQEHDVDFKSSSLSGNVSTTLSTTCYAPFNGPGRSSFEDYVTAVYGKEAQGQVKLESLQFLYSRMSVDSNFAKQLTAEHDCFQLSGLGDSPCGSRRWAHNEGQLIYNPQFQGTHRNWENPDHSWMEVTRWQIPCTPPEIHCDMNGYGCWFFVTPGSGVFVNVGRSLRRSSRDEVDHLLNAGNNGTWCQRALELGYDSIQVGTETSNYVHHSSGSKKRDQTELVICSGGCQSNLCSLCPPIEMRSGVNGASPCKCNEDSGILNCGNLRPTPCCGPLVEDACARVAALTLPLPKVCRQGHLAHSKITTLVKTMMKVIDLDTFYQSGFSLSELVSFAKRYDRGSLFRFEFLCGLLMLTVAAAYCLGLDRMPGIAAPERRWHQAPRNVSKEFLLVIGVITTGLQGGGLIFGFSAFADRLLQLPGSPYRFSTVSGIFAVGHNIAAFGCVGSGMLVDSLGPRVCAVSGLAMQAVGHLGLAHATQLPELVIMVAYGLLGLGGCQVFLAALTFAAAFLHSSWVSSLLTAAFQAGGFVFMVLPYVRWEAFFYFYCAFCILGAIIAGLLYPDEPLLAHRDAQDVQLPCHDESGKTLKDLLLTPRIFWFLLTFMIAGSAFIYGAGEFPAALQAKDICMWDELQGDFTNCQNQRLQDHLNFVAMPFVGNFIFPFSLVIGFVIDRWGFAIPALISVVSVQAFLVALWLFGLNSQYVTLFLYNIANSTLFTNQNAYICDVGHEHIGKLFAVSNFVLSLGNLAADWLNMNPFGEGSSRVGKSLATSCAFWLVITCPLYAWAAKERSHSRKDDERSDK